MDAESLAPAAVAAIRVREPAPTAHMYGALSRLHSPFFQARYIHRTPCGVRFDHRLGLGPVSRPRALEVLGHRSPRNMQIVSHFQTFPDRTPPTLNLLHIPAP